jgi:hypothetical protein
MAMFADTPTVLGDEVDYFLAARQPEGHPGLLSLAYPPLYPGLLSIGAAMGSRETGYLLSRLLNAVISSTIVPLSRPLWAPSGVLGGCAVGLLPSGVITSGLLLSENLFGPVLAAWLLAAARWGTHPSATAAVFLGLAASAASLTRAAGGAVVLATFVLIAGRKLSLRAALAALGGMAPIVAYLVVRHLNPPCSFNDPLAVGHPPEIARALTPDLADLTRGTMLEPVAALLPWPFLFAVAWGGYWSLQYGLYVVFGTAGLAAGALDRRMRAACPARRMLTPLLLVSGASILLAANHTLAGVQAAQFVRGRYVEPLLPLWCAFAMGSLATTARARIPWWPAAACSLAGFVQLTAAQNRALDFLYPIRSVVLRLPSLQGALVGGLVGLLAYLTMRAMLGTRPFRRYAMPAFVVVSLAASLLRYDRQQSDSAARAVSARWLAIHDSAAGVEVETQGRASDALKACGLTWVVQQIRFFSDNPLTLAPDVTASYSLVACGDVDGSGRPSGVRLVRRE